MEGIRIANSLVDWLNEKITDPTTFEWNWDRVPFFGPRSKVRSGVIDAKWRERENYAAQRGGVPRRGNGGGRGFEFPENPTPPRPSVGVSGYTPLPRCPYKVGLARDYTPDRPPSNLILRLRKCVTGASYHDF